MDRCADTSDTGSNLRGGWKVELARKGEGGEEEEEEGQGGR